MLDELKCFGGDLTEEVAIEVANLWVDILGSAMGDFQWSFTKKRIVDRRDRLC